MSAPTVFVIDDEEHLRKTAAQTFDLADIACKTFANGETAIAEITRDFPGVVVTDIRMPDISGEDVLKRILEIDPDLPVIMVTGHGDVSLAVANMRSGAYDFIEKPFKPDDLTASVQRALEKRRLTLENRELRLQADARTHTQNRLIGQSDVMVQLRKQIRAIAATDVDVLITGPTGAGKDIAARTLHEIGARADGEFVHVNCAALPEALVESELFGHEAGAFPGATRARFGKFEHARNGTLCLDEIDSLTPALQAKLLHALQHRTISRLGSNEIVSLDLRVIAISKRDLRALIVEGQFREDLYFLLNVAHLHLPELTQRREDIPELFLTLVTEAAARHNYEARKVDESLLQALAARDWPGNVRELKNIADRFVLDLGLGLSEANGHIKTDLNAVLAAYEKAIISAAITTHQGRLKPTYEALGISRKTLYEKMQKHGLSRPDNSENT